MRKILTFLFAALMSVGMWATTVTWYGIAITPGSTYSNGGVAITCNEITDGEGDPPSISGPGTFTSSIGNFTKIEINANEENFSGAGWVDVDYWTGNASSVEFNGYINGVSQIKFTIEDATVAVTGVTLDQNAAEMTVGGETLTLTATVNPEDATDKSVSWSTSDGNVATVDNGVVTAVAAGTATITVTTNDGSYTATCDVTVTAPEPANSCGDGLTWEYNSTTNALTISYDGTGTGAMTDFDEDHPAPWFSYRESITSVIIPDGVTRIGSYAFASCSGLTSIEIPGSVTSIGDYAISECYGLTSITIPNSVKSIGASAFVMCSSLASIEIPNSVISIGETAFFYCTGLTSVTIGNSVTSIGMGAFAYCPDLASVTILAESLESYGTYAFEGTAAALKIYVPAGSVATYKAGWADYEDKIVAIGGGSTPTDEQVPTNVDPENPSYYYSTFFHSTQNYKLTNDGTTAFIADLSGNDLILTEIAKGSEVIPANTAVIFRKAGSAEPVALTPTEENGVSVNPEDNDLEGVDAITAVTSIDGLTRDNCYVLSGQQSVGFYLINSDNLKAHKAYVKYVSTPGQSNAPKKMRFVFNTTTGVESAQPSVISGQKLIENGQLIIIKNGVRYNAQGQIVK